MGVTSCKRRSPNSALTTRKSTVIKEHRMWNKTDSQISRSLDWILCLLMFVLVCFGLDPQNHTNTRKTSLSCHISKLDLLAEPSTRCFSFELSLEVDIKQNIWPLTFEKWKTPFRKTTRRQCPHYIKSYIRITHMTREDQTSVYLWEKDNIERTFDRYEEYNMFECWFLFYFFLLF